MESLNPTQSIMKFSHVKPNDTPWRSDGLRGFFEYRDLGIRDATDGKVICHLVRAAKPPTEGTGWHIHVLDFQIVIMNKGWAKFMYGDKSVTVSAGDVVHQQPGLIHYLYDYSPDMEYTEICSPADFGSLEVHGHNVVIPPASDWR
jgi:mannose-6-phosphate isomerase-like protein (cupin superfamily)